MTKLPVELVNQIEEEYILRVMSVFPRKAMEKWETDHSCWTSDCVIRDHFEDDRMVEIYNDEMSDRFAATGVCPCECGRTYDEYLQGCVDPEQECYLWARHVSENVLDLVGDLAIENESVEDEYKECCQRRREGWLSRTTRASDGGTGQLDRIEALLKAHFGLEIWVNHLKVVSCTAARSHSKG